MTLGYWPCFSCGRKWTCDFVWPAEKVVVEVEGGTRHGKGRHSRGKGFDESAIPDGRMGVRQSIRARMERHGGTAVIRSEPGDGTEVRLEI